MKKVDFREGSVFSNLIQTATPMLVAQVLHLLYNIVDRVYIGRIPGAGTDALGAVGLCFPIILIITGFTNMYGMGGSPLFSMELGRGDPEKAARIQNTAFRLLTITALIITVVGEVFAIPLLRLFGAGNAELPTALSYFRYYLPGTPFLMVSTGMNPYITGQGFSMVAMFSVATGALANLLLDPIFIFVMGMGVKGAAIATVLSQILSAVIIMRFLTGPRNEFRISFSLSFPYALQIISLGISPFIMQATNSLVQIVCNNVLMQTGGAMFVSIMTIISSVRSILDVPVMALSEGTSPIISFNYGARKSKKVREAIRLMLTIAIPYTFIVWVLIQVVPGAFISIFSNDPLLRGDAIRALHLYFFAFIFQSLQYGGQTTFKALNKKKQTIFFSLFRKVIMVVPLTYLLPFVFGLGTDGVFMAEPISNFIGGTACFTTMLLTVLPELKAMEQNAEAPQRS